jgi:hypothetical protein
VNPTTSAVTVQLGATYLDDGGNPVTSVTLGATTGAVLRSTGEPPPPPPPPPPGGISLTASVSGTSVTLSWTGMSDARADVFRNGSRVTTVTNRGSYVDRLARRTHGTFTYRVCGAGTSTCSNDATVTVGSTQNRLTARRVRAHARTRVRHYARFVARRR